MSGRWFEIFIPVVGLMINILVQVLSFRNIPKLGLLKSEYLGFGFGLVSIFLLKSPIAIFMVNLITYCALGYCYFIFINLGETARRIRILTELYDYPEGLSLSEILERYNAKEIVERRLDRLLGNGQIVLVEGRYRIGKPVMLIIAKIIVSLKLFILGRRSEFSAYDFN